MKELGISSNRLRKAGAVENLQRVLDFGVAGSCTVSEIVMTRGNIDKAKKYIDTTFPGGSKNICKVQVCNTLFPIRHAMFRLGELLTSILHSLDNEVCDKYRVWFLDEQHQPLQYVYTVAFPIDGTKMSKSGVGSKGGDTHVTLLLAQLLNYPLSVGKTTQNYLVGIFNCAETKLYLKLLLYFLDKEAEELDKNPLELVLKHGRQVIKFRFRAKGDLKFHNVAQSCGTQSCDIAFAHFMVFMSLVQLTWNVIIGIRSVGEPFEFSRKVTEVSPFSGEMETVEYLCAHQPTADAAKAMCNENNKILLSMKGDASTSDASRICSVRESAYSNGNNFVSTLGPTCFEVYTAKGCNFSRMDNTPELYAIENPLISEQTAIDVLSTTKFLYDVTYDNLHLNMNQVGKGFNHTIISAESRSLHQGAKQHDFSVSKVSGANTSCSTFQAFDLYNIYALAYSVETCCYGCEVGTSNCCKVAGMLPRPSQICRGKKFCCSEKSQWEAVNKICSLQQLTYSVIGI